jgi:hypothetical protein
MFTKNNMTWAVSRGDDNSWVLYALNNGFPSGLYARIVDKRIYVEHCSIPVEAMMLLLEKSGAFKPDCSRCDDIGYLPSGDRCPKCGVEDDTE